jgi:hypothetical protein
MANIPASQARALFTKLLIDVYQERPLVTSFLRGFFPVVTAPTKDISIEVERMGEKIAVDVLRGTEGNRNNFSRQSMKEFTPPLYREYFDATQLDLYERVLGAQGDAQSPLFAALLNKVADRLENLRDKIERAKELQCAQVLETGIVTLKNADQIDYKRRAGSLVDDGAGQYFANAIDPFPKFEAAGNFLRQFGKSPDGIFNCIMGSTALADLLNNAKFQARQNLFNMALDAVQGPVRDANTGATFHGIITAGSYKFQLWAYPQFYEDPNNGNALTPYVNAKKVIVIPMKPRFKMAHAAVPQLVGEPGQLPVQGEYVMGDFPDPRKATHEFDIQSSPLAIPIAVDQAYTFKAVA